MKAIFDTETTGVPLWKEPSDHPDQPHLVQFAAILLDDDGIERMAVNALIKPDGWTIPAEVVALHGITTEMAARFGIAEATAVRLFLDLAQMADITVAAHNDGFDWRIMRIAMLRAGKSKDEADAIEAKCQRVCTMKLAYASTKHRPDKPLKWPPSLTECIAHFFGETFDTAHDAMADARACARVWRVIQAQQAQTVTGAAA